MAGAPARTTLPSGAVVGDRYRIVRPLGSGAMGTVYEAARDDGSSVALKTLASPDAARDTAERRARFLREAAICAQIEHPHVMSVLDHGVDAATEIAYLVMPLFVGADLERILATAGTLTPAAAAPLFVQACHGLAAAHAAGVIHRDIKPSNLFVVENDQGLLTVKVSDFGLAKVHDAAVDSLTASGRFMGTPHYVSPEQATNAKRVDARTDVWSLAMTLYRALAGAPAFRARTFMALVLELTGPEGVPPLQDRAPWVAPALARVVHAALVRDLALRCPSAAELAIAIETAVGVDAARRPLTRESLRAPAADERARAPRAALPASWDELLRFG